MLDLIKHIEYLLTEHDCVVVPELGGFVLQYTPARFSDDRKSVQPPGKQIIFNPSLSYNDGLLAQSLMQSRNIDYVNAVALIEHCVGDMKKNFSKPGDSYVFGNLGVFTLSNEMSLIFEPNPAYLLGIASFGLKKINICPLSQLHKEEDVAEIKDIRKKKDVIYIPINRNFIRQMVAAVAIVIVMLMISTPISEINTTSDYASIVSAELFENNSGATKDINLLSQQKDSTIPVSDKISVPEEDNKEIVYIPQEDIVKRHIIVVATLSGKQAALRQLENFRRQGIKDDLKIYETANKVRIYIDSFSDKGDAQKYLRNLRSENPSFSDAWIMTVKK